MLDEDDPRKLYSGYIPVMAWSGRTLNACATLRSLSVEDALVAALTELRRPTGDLQRSEEGRRAVTIVVVQTSFGLAEADRKQRRRTILGLDLRLLTTQMTTALARGRDVPSH